MKLTGLHASPLIALLLAIAACGTDPVLPSVDGGGNDGRDMGACADCDDDLGIVDDNVCGDLDRGFGESCDDGNTESGDGCSSLCRQEEGWTCPRTGPCEQTDICGNGTRDGDDECDDGNTDGDDGCSADCMVEPGWRCPTEGEACVVAGCGDGIRAGDEACDDANMNDGDGCSATCVVEAGWVCLEDGTCIAQQCGDSILAGDEACDDGNVTPGDGCAADCSSVEPNYICPEVGRLCESTVVCGDRRVGPGEQCDDGGTEPLDGCDASCMREPGWVCPVPGASCRAERCGDGVVVDTEVCDDANLMDGDGCSSACQVEAGWACPPQASCYRTTCGDGTREGTEQCDDGNLRPFDGCSQDCTNEPTCSGGVCTPICGDGVILPGPTQEACDDGNTDDGDGCSATCTVEAGWMCSIQPEPLANSIELPLIVRDFKGIQWYADNATEYGHPDFNDPDDGNAVISFGLVEANLGPNGRPVLAYPTAPATDDDGIPKSSARFDQWYDSASPWNIEEVRYLALTRAAATDTFVYDSTATGFPPNSTDGFYPIDDGGWVAQGSEALRSSSSYNDGGDHNFNFTTETRFFFQYEGDEVLRFTGDDDLWVFIDGVLCLDVGGLHAALSATMNLADPSQETNATQRAIVQACRAHLDGLVTANNPTPLVEMVIFHAERHTQASNFDLELTGFVKERTTCEEECGDGVLTRGEVCDDGTNDGSYNGCTADCLGFGPYCGDGAQNGAEACDDGVAANDGRYGGCNPDCTVAGFCGDAVVQPQDEVCDDGVNDGAYGGCATDCQMRADYCGDGVVNGPEECDEGLGGNLGDYDGCNPNCTLAAYCGDGIRQGEEQCDDANNNDADGCNRECKKPVL